MKFSGALPDQKHYRKLQSTKEGVWLFEDKGTPALRIKSPVPNPWSRQSWIIVAGRQKQNSDLTTFPYRLMLSLYETVEPGSSPAIPVSIEREMVKGVFAWSDHQPVQFYAFLHHASEQIPKWVFYSFYKA